MSSTPLISSTENIASSSVDRRRCAVGKESHLDAAILLLGEGAVGLRSFLERQAVRENGIRVEAAGADVFDEEGDVSLHAHLSRPDGELLVHRRAEVHEGPG